MVARPKGPEALQVRACGKLRSHQSLPAAEPRTSRAGASAAEELDECEPLCAAPVPSLLLECVIAASAYRTDLRCALARLGEVEALGRSGDLLFSSGRRRRSFSWQRGSAAAQLNLP